VVLGGKFGFAGGFWGDPSFGGGLVPPGGEGKIGGLVEVGVSMLMTRMSTKEMIEIINMGFRHRVKDCRVGLLMMIRWL
jgi:hypothetical protein